MANHIVKISVAALDAQMRLALNSGLAIAILAATAMNTPWFTACAQDLPNAQPIARVVAPTGAATARYPLSRAGQGHRLFFGFLEFDWDPNAPGGVPGFGPLADPHHVANR